MKKNARRQYYKDEEALGDIGLKIRDARILNNISQERLANECGIDYNQINRIELGKVNFTISNLYRIAKALNVNAKDLLT